MQEVAAIIDAGAFHDAQEQIAEQSALAVKNLFLLLQGSYGAVFIAKFATGVKDETGRHDLGIRATMAVWRHALKKYPPDVIETAAARLKEAHTEFPPSLPQFEKLCDAAMPRKTHAEEAGLPRLPAPAPAAPVKVDFSKQNDGKDWARAIMARSEAGESIRAYTLLSARQALGLEGRMPWH